MKWIDQPDLYVATRYELVATFLRCENAMALSYRLVLASVILAFCFGDAAGQDRKAFDDWVNKKLPSAVRVLNKVDSVDYRREAVLDLSSKNKDGKIVKHRLTILNHSSMGNRYYSSSVSDVSPVGATVSTGVGLVGENTRYLFQLGRNKRNDGWLLEGVYGKTELLPKNTDTQFATLRNDTEPAFAKAQSIVLRNRKVTPVQLAELPGFELLSFTELAEGRKGEVKFSFLEDILTAQVVVACTVVYDLNTYGLPIDFSYRYQYKETVNSHSFSFDMAPSGIDEYTKVSQTKTEYSTASGPVVSESASIRAVTKLGRTPDSAFTLTAFGLPEPAGFEPPSTPTYVWLLVAATVFFTLVVVFRFIARRSAAKSYA